MSQPVYTSHPGAASYPRLMAVRAAALSTYFVELPANAELFSAAALLAQQFPDTSLLLRLSGIEFTQAALHVVEDGRGGKMVEYGPAIEVPTSCTLVAGHMTIGWDNEGQPICHCHGYLSLPDGRLLGGHLARGRCHLARQGARIHLSVLKDTTLCPQDDGETGFRLLTPAQTLGGAAWNL